MNTAHSRPVPVLALEGVVLFPHVRRALHVAELRHRTLVRDALSGGRVLAVATALGGQEPLDREARDFHELGCLARFERVEWLPNDRYDLELVGLERVRLGRSLRTLPYHACEVEVLPAAPFDADDPLAAMERAALLAAAQRLAPLGEAAWEQAPPTAAPAPFEAVVNGLAHALRLDTATRLELLALDSVFERARRLHEHLKRRLGSAPPTGGEGDGRN